MAENCPEAALLVPSEYTARRLEEILGITPMARPGDRWSSVKLGVESGEIVYLDVSFIVSVDQLHEIVDLLKRVPTWSGADDAR